MLFGFLAVASCDKTSRAMAVMLACSLRICAGGRITTVRVTRALHFVRLPSGASVFSSSCLTPSIAGSNPAPSASYYVLDIAYIIVFLGSLFSREFAGVTGLVFKAIRGRDGCTRDFGRGRYENLSGAISWLTFFAGRAAHVRRSQRDWRRELAESTICSQQKPRSFRCSAQSVGSRGVRRINVLAVSCGGFRPLTMAVVMSGASQGRRRRE